MENRSKSTFCVYNLNSTICVPCITSMYILLSAQLHLIAFCNVSVSRARPAAVDLPWLLLHHDKPKYVGSGDPVYVIRWTLNAPADSSPVRFLPHYITVRSTVAPLVKTEELNSKERNQPKSWPWAFPISLWNISLQASQSRNFSLMSLSL